MRRDVMSFDAQVTQSAFFARMVIDSGRKPPEGLVCARRGGGERVTVDWYIAANMSRLAVQREHLQCRTGEQLTPRSKLLRTRGDHGNTASGMIKDCSMSFNEAEGTLMASKTKRGLLSATWRSSRKYPRARLWHPRREVAHTARWTLDLCWEQNHQRIAERPASGTCVCSVSLHRRPLVAGVALGAKASFRAAWSLLPTFYIPA
ncbi:hypothetical protein IQ07DRAFT_274805 [Pyrenochaeta sp. DS3sAY3a]|nr:hypothetical protein IQ07DRAFT_274805 [Pyrenochaeta sp. DS3sAY3a]